MTIIFAVFTLLVPTVPVFSAVKTAVKEKTLVVYYSYTGNTELAARTIAKELGADLKKIEDVERPSKIKVKTMGVIAAARGQTWEIRPVEINLSEYGRIFVGSPIWKGNPTPEINAFISRSDFAGKPVVVFVTMEKNPKDGLKKMSSRVEAKGGRVVGMFAIQVRGPDTKQVVEKVRTALKGLQR